ncbi:MAG: ABC transporter ATP-binding protein [Anaerolineales bacterium]
MPEIELEEEEFTSQITLPVFKRILGLLKPHWRWLTGFLLAVAMTSLLDSLFTYINKGIIDQGIMQRNTQALYRLAMQYGFWQIVQAAMVFGFIYLAGMLGERVQYDLRKMTFEHLQDLSLAYYARNAVGRLMTRVTSDSERVADLMTWGLLDVTWALMGILTATVFMLIINWKLALIVFAMMPLLVYVAIQFRKKILLEFRETRRMNSKITGAYNETITGVRVIKALNREEENLGEFKDLTRGMFRASYRAAWLSALFLPAVQFIAAVVLAIIVWYGGLQALNGALTVGGIHAFVSYVTFMLWPVQDLARVFSELQRAIASAERIFTLVDTEPEVRDLPGAVPAETLMGTITFEHVDFYYEARKPVIRDLSLRIEPGETIALVGPTGGGKSTIVNLLCRFYEPRRGVIRIGGRDYREYTLDSIHQRIGMVLQTPHLFSGSIRENIRYGRQDASDADVEAAARLAGAHDFIITLEKGYDTEVGEGGTLLSTGQKQLISLARAILAQPEIFIMDEATSSVDTLTEALIQRGMETLLAGRTSVVIAHRLSTIRRADRILVIENGRIAESGTHAELLRQRGHYYRLYTQQFRHELEERYEVSRTLA